MSAVRAVVINSKTASYSTPTATGKSIAKEYQWLNRLAHAGLERLEPDDAKVCAVKPASQIPAAGRRSQEGYFWAIRLTRGRKSDGTRAWRKSAGGDEHAKPNAVQGPRDMAKAGLLEPQLPAVETHTSCHGV